jgi:hypothetical protein
MIRAALEPAPEEKIASFFMAQNYGSRDERGLYFACRVGDTSMTEGQRDLS